MALCLAAGPSLILSGAASPPGPSLILMGKIPLCLCHVASAGSDGAKLAQFSFPLLPVSYLWSFMLCAA